MGTPLEEYDFFGGDPDSTDDPYAFFALAREQGPVYKDPRTGVYILLRYDDVACVAKDVEGFSSIVSERGPLTPFPGARPGQSVPEALLEYRREHPQGDIPLLTLDPPEHGRMRTLCGKLFTPNRMTRHEKRIRETADSLISEFLDAGRCEWITAFAHPMAFLVICELFGVPRADQLAFMEAEQRTNRQVRPGSPNSADAAGRSEMDEAARRRNEYFIVQLSERRENPRNDIMTEYVNNPHRDSGELPDVAELYGIAATIFGAGQETTVHMFASGMRILTERPELQKELRENPELIPRFVEEVLRCEPPVKGLHRLALHDTTISGVEIPAGSIVALSWAAANRDPERWLHPDEFDLHREDWHGNMSFGHGPHSCVGAPLARAEGQLGFEQILARTRSLRRARDAEPLEYMPTFVLRALKVLPIEFDAA